MKSTCGRRAWGGIISGLYLLLLVYSLASCLIKEDPTAARGLLEDLAGKGHGVVSACLAYCEQCNNSFNIGSLSSVGQVQPCIRWHW